MINQKGEGAVELLHSVVGRVEVADIVPPGAGVLPCADPLELIQRLARTPLRGRALYFSAELLVALKEQARQELLEAGDAVGAAALRRFQALGSLMWRCVTRARRLVPYHEAVFCVAVND